MTATLYTEVAYSGAASDTAAAAAAVDDCDTGNCFYCTSPETD